mmetsp:Transcript_87225/g.164493  ORF Transcript_87225/g.164493 Transcript_87225/m.164493 type:complete len:82 (+) Transcript_87225:3-248(+)
MRHFFECIPIALSLILLIWGWSEYSKTTEELCVNPDEDVNPRTLTFVYLLIASICMPLACCGTVAMALGGGNMTEIEQLNS